METCRFCLEDSLPTTLLDPCQCRGSVRYVHEACLEQELIMRARHGMSTQNCRICGTAYALLHPLPLMMVSSVMVPLVLVYITLQVTNPVVMTILYVVALVNWTLCFCWKLVPVLFILRNRWMQSLLSIGLLVPIAHWGPTLAILAAFSIPYATFVVWVSENGSHRRILFGCIALAEVCLLMAALVSTTYLLFNACLLLSVLCVIPMSVLMLTV